MINNVITSTITTALDNLAAMPIPTQLYCLGINNGEGLAICLAFLVALVLMGAGALSMSYMTKRSENLGMALYVLGLGVFTSVLGLGFFMSCVAGSI